MPTTHSDTLGIKDGNHNNTFEIICTRTLYCIHSPS